MTKLRTIERFHTEAHVTAEVFFGHLGSPGIVVIQADTDEGPADVTLTPREAHDLMLWLQCALGLSEPTPPVEPTVKPTALSWHNVHQWGQDTRWTWYQSCPCALCAAETSQIAARQAAESPVKSTPEHVHDWKPKDGLLRCSICLEER